MASAVDTRTHAAKYGSWMEAMPIAGYRPISPILVGSTLIPRPVMRCMVQMVHNLRRRLYQLNIQGSQLQREHLHIKSLILSLLGEETRPGRQQRCSRVFW